MKSNLKSVAQPHTGLTLRTQLRVGEYADAKDYETQFHTQYGCEKKSYACDENRWNFYNNCSSNCSDQGYNSTCMNTCHDGFTAIANGWGRHKGRITP